MTSLPAARPRIALPDISAVAWEHPADRAALQTLRAVPGVDEAEVQLVFSPPWGAHMMSDAVKLELGLL